MPTMDGVTRRGYMQLTDGTTAVGVDITTQALKVYQVNETNTGTNVTNYATSSAVAASASSAHTYTTTSGKTLTLKQVIAAASGAMKVEIQTGAAGSETTKYVAWLDQHSTSRSRTR
jgi:hypothetical protein